MRKYLIYFVRWVLLLLDSKAFDIPEANRVVYIHPESVRLKYNLALSPYRSEKAQIENAKHELLSKLKEHITVLTWDDRNALHEYNHQVELRLTVAVIPEK